MDDLDRRLVFLRETEKLKSVYRQAMLSDLSRHESSAEHSWHMALMLLLFEKELPAGIDVHKAVTMALIHDIVEVDAGDTMFFDEEARKGKAVKEKAAAERLFGLLPAGLATEYAALFQEFEECKTEEAKLVKAFDRLHPIAMNLASDGSSWKKHGIRAEQLETKKRPDMQHAITRELFDRLLAEAKERGLLK